MTVIEGDPYTPRAADDDHLEDAADVLEDAKEVGGAHSFSHGGEVFTLRGDVDLRVLIALQRGNMARALELALADGAKGVDRIMASDEALTMDVFGGIVDRWVKAASGATPGESPASPS